MFKIGLFDTIKKSVSKAVKSVDKVIKATNTQIKLPISSNIKLNTDVLTGVATILSGVIKDDLNSNAIEVKSILDVSNALQSFEGILEPLKKALEFAIELGGNTISESLFKFIEPFLNKAFQFNGMDKPISSEITFEGFLKWLNNISSLIFGIKPFNLWIGKDSWIDESKKGTYYDVMKFIVFAFIVWQTSQSSILSFFNTMINHKISEYYAYSKLGIHDYQMLEFRGILEKNELSEMSKFLGYDSRTMRNVKKISEYYPNVSDLTNFAVREAFDPDEKLFIHGGNAIPPPFLDYALKLGIDEFWVKKFWHSHWRLLGASEVLEAFHRKFLSKTELLDYLRRLDYVEKDRNVIMNMSYNLLTRVDIRRIFESGLISSKDMFDYYGTLGFSEKDQILMTELAKQLRFVETGDLRKIYIEQFENGLISESEFKQSLRETGLDSDEILNYMWLSDTQKELDFKIELKKRIETKFYDGDIDFEGLVQELRALGVSNRELKRIEKNAILFDFRKKKLPTLAELKRFIKKDIIDLNQFVYYALRLGLEKEHIIWILQDMQIIE